MTSDTLVLKVVEPDESDPLPKLSATIKCPVCKHEAAISQQCKKLAGGSRGKLNWNICNFQSHYKIHVKVPVSKAQLGGTLNPSGNSSSNVPPETSISIISVEGNGTEIDPVECSNRVKVSRKRKFNVISDTDDGVESGLLENSESGELLSGVLERQNTPEIQLMP